VADQSFVGGNYATTTETTLWLGQGDYTDLRAGSAANNSVLLETSGNEYFFFSMDEFQMGSQSSNNEGCFTSLSFEGQKYPSIKRAALNFNFQGVGLPKSFWDLTVSYLQRVSESVSNDLNCDGGLGGKCNLSKTCDNYAELW